MNVKEIIVAALKDMDCQGLCGDECGCAFADGVVFMPCCEGSLIYCKPAYQLTPAQAKAAGFAEDADADFVMVPTSEWERCWECDGKGLQKVNVAGRICDDPCLTCNGARFVRRKKEEPA